MNSTRLINTSQPETQPSYLNRGNIYILLCHTHHRKPYIIHYPSSKSIIMLRTSLARLAQPLSARGLHTTRPVQSLQNIFETSDRPSLTIAKLTPKGFHLSDDLVVPGGLVLAGYQALLWNVDPPKGDGSGGMEEAWKGWTKERFQVFESVVPRPGQLLALQR